MYRGCTKCAEVIDIKAGREPQRPLNAEDLKRHDKGNHQVELARLGM
jgi:hypothetical protein